MKFVQYLAVILSLMIASVAGYAQESLQERQADQQAIKQELVQKIEQIKYEKIKTALGLDDESAKKFFETYKPAEKDIQGLVKQRNDELKKLAEMMNGAKTDADVDPEMQKIRDLNQQISNREQRLDSDLKPILSPRQRARLLMFEHEFNQRVREQLAKRAKNGQLQALRRQIAQQRLKNRLLKQKNQAKGNGLEHP